MKKINHLLLFGVLLTFSFLVSCSKTQQPEPNAEVETETLNIEEQVVETVSELMFYIDNVLVTQLEHQDFEIQKSNEIVESYVFGGDPNDLNSTTVSTHSFTTLSLALEFSDRYGLKLEKSNEFEDRAEQLAILYDVEAYYDINGDVPEKYSKAIDELYLEIFEGKEKLLTFLRKNCSGGVWPVQFHLIFMPPTWNNSVSSHQHLAVGGVLNLYDKWRFKEKRKTFVNWGLNTICYPTVLTTVNNIMSSTLVFSI